MPPSLGHSKQQGHIPLCKGNSPSLLADFVKSDTTFCCEGTGK